jgi:FKBP-type peptidyl-prolyl cis-trans isomerase FkpA
LGTGFWASLHTNVDLVLGGKTVPSNIWYLGLHRSSEAAWTLTLMDSSKVARSGQISGSTRDVKPDLSVPMTLSKGQDLAKNLKIELEVDDAKVGHGRLRIWWGQYELATRFHAAVVEMKPVGEPKFAKLNPKRTVTTKSGLMYEELRSGIGRMPKPLDTVVVRYVGWGEDGKRFDSTFLRKQPFTFRVTGGVIAGWCEGIQKMKPGAVFRFRIPPDLAYGKRGAGHLIQPNATIEFWIELLSIK